MPQKTDVAILGAGYTGLSAALVLARQGASVLVLEKERVGFGASSRNGGQVLSGLKVSPRELLERFGERRAVELYGYSLRAIEFLEEVIRREEIACDYTRCGHLEAAVKPAHFEGLKRDRDLLGKVFRREVALVSRNQQHGELGSDFYHGLLLDERSGSLHPARYVFGLAKAAMRAGADVRERTPALGIERRNGSFLVKTPAGSIEARDVIVATNGYTDGAVPRLRRRLVPVGSFIIATEPLAGEQADSILPKRRVVFDTKNFLYCFRVLADNSFLFGGRAQWTPSTPRSTERSARILRDAMVRVFPGLRKTVVRWAWSGNVCFTRDLLPRMGTIDGVHFACGYAGHGVAMSTYLGGAVARMVAGESCDRPFGDLPLRRLPLYDGRPWFLPFVGIYYRSLDWLH